MRFVNVYLLVYVLLIIGALFALWQGGALQHMSPVWVLAGLVTAAGFGIVLSISAGKPDIARD